THEVCTKYVRDMCLMEMDGMGVTVYVGLGGSCRCSIRIGSPGAFRHVNTYDRHIRGLVKQLHLQRPRSAALPDGSFPRWKLPFSLIFNFDFPVCSFVRPRLHA